MMTTDLIRAIDKELENILSPGSFKEVLGQKYFGREFGDGLIKPMRELISRGGKRWRPQLLVLCAEAVAKQKYAARGRRLALKLSVVPELLHNATLIVDDLEDNSPLRRGKPAIHKMFGVDMAVNAANFFYFYALRYAAKTTPLSIRQKVLDAIAEEMTNVHLGQALDIYWHNHSEHPVSEKQYLEMCRLKTGTMARLAARLGALIAHAPKSKERALGRFAETLGIAFQIKDDLENITGAGRPGKQFGDDITEGKRSLLVIRALQKLPAVKAQELKAILARHTPDPLLIKHAVGIISETDAISYAESAAQELKLRALVSLRMFKKNQRQILVAFTSRLG